jgi:hypothetical protein
LDENTAPKEGTFALTRPIPPPKQQGKGGQAYVRGKRDEKDCAFEVFSHVEAGAGDGGGGAGNASATKWKAPSIVRELSSV